MIRPRSAARLAAGLALVGLLAPTAASADHRVAVPISGGPGNSSADFKAASADGGKVLFSTNQALVGADQDSESDLYVREGGRLTLVSIADGGFDNPEGVEFKAATPTLSHIVWQSKEDMTGTDSDGGQPDLYVNADGQTSQVTTTPFPSFDSVNPYLSVLITADGRIAFQTNSRLLFTDNDGGLDDVYEYFNGTVKLVSSGGSAAVILRGMSADGTRIFMSTTGVLAAPDADAVVDVYERVNGTTTNLLTPDTTLAADWAGASADGSHVYFHTVESLNAVLDQDAKRDVYVRAAGATSLISTSATAGNGDFDASFQRASADGSRVIFTTDEAMDPADEDGLGGEPLDDIYLREAGVTTLVSGGEITDGAIVIGEMTPDGQHIFWYSSQTFAGDTDGGFVDAWHWNDGTISRISVGEQNDQIDENAFYAGRSGDLSSFVFQTAAQMTADDTDVFEDLYERDGDTTRLLTPSAETCTLLPSPRCVPHFMGADQTGDRVWFTSEESLHPADDDDASLGSSTDVYESRYLGIPEVTTDPAVNALVEGDPAPIDPSLTVTEASDDLFGATVEITAGFEATDVLAYQDGTVEGITGSLNPEGTKLTLTGRGTAGDFEAALRSVTYTTLSEAPSGATRTIVFTVDNGGHTGSGSRSLTVVPGNDAPLVVAGPQLPDYVEGAGAIALLPELEVSEADDTELTGATVRVSGGFVDGEDVLAFTAAGGITGSQAGDTLTLAGTATLAQYQAALRSVTYENTAEDPTEGQRVFDVVVTDGDRESNPVQQFFGVFRRTIDVTNATLVYTENAVATAVDPDLTITNFPADDIEGATVEFTEGFAAGEDQLAFADTATITATLSEGGRKLTLAGLAPVADYLAALRSVTYRNTSEAPSGADRLIAFAVTAGLGSDARRIDVVPVDDAPLMTAGAAGDPFEENGLPAPIAPALTVTDVDSASLTGGVVRIEGGYHAGHDELTTTEKLPDGILGAWDPATATYTLTGTASVADYVSALRSLALTNDAEDPPAAQRVISFGVSSAGAAATPVTLKIGVTMVNDVPVVSVSGTPLAYTEGDDPVAVDGGLQLTDPDSTIQGATVQLAGGQQEGEDVLEIDDADDGITVNVAESGQSITLAGTASVTAYRTALRAVRYSNRSAAATGNRTVSLQVTDGTAVSNVAARTIVLGTRPPQALTPPAITGVTRVGGVLTGARGDWSGSEPMTFTLAWQRCAENGTGCTDIEGASGETYAPAVADVGSKLRLRVVADNSVDGDVTALSVLTAVIRAALAAPGITAGPAALVADDDAVIRFGGEDGAAFTCALDGAAFAACAPPVALAGVADGAHVLRIRQTREGLTSSEAERRWTVDTTAPKAPVLLAGPDPTTTAKTAAVTFAGLPGESFECALDGADFAACAPPVALEGLELGLHTLLVRAVDAAGNRGAALRVRWMVATSVIDPGKATRMTLRAPAAIPRGARSFLSGCTLDAGVLARCEVIARVSRRGHLVRIGRGVSTSAAGRSAGVRVVLTAAGRRALRRAGRNARVRLTGRATQAGSPFNLIDTASVRAR